MPVQFMGDIMIRKLILVLGILIWTTMCGTASAGELGIITGGAKGTYFQFGLNLKELGKKFGYNIQVYNCRGSVENVYAVYKRPKTEMGIVQSDVLAFVLKVQSNKVLKSIARKTKMVFPLYNEEVHLLGKTEVASFDDLENRRVAVDKEGSGTYLTAKLLFEVSGIKPAQTLAVGTDDALSMLKAGTIDAMFYVAGFPVALFFRAGYGRGWFAHRAHRQQKHYRILPCCPDSGRHLSMAEPIRIHRCGEGCSGLL